MMIDSGIQLITRLLPQEFERLKCWYERLLPSLPSFMKGDSAALGPDSCAEPPMPSWGVGWGVQASILIQ
jgi:hypothetical protein